MTERARVLIITFSDTRTRENDESGALLAELFAPLADVVERMVVREDRASIDAALDAALAADVDAVVTTGGTGIAPRDIAIEAISSRLDKHLDGFGEAFRRLSWDEIGPRAILSRALAGTAGTKLVVCLPGSAKAVRLGMERVLLPILPHARDLLRGKTAHGHSSLSIG